MTHQTDARQGLPPEIEWPAAARIAIQTSQGIWIFGTFRHAWPKDDGGWQGMSVAGENDYWIPNPQIHGPAPQGDDWRHSITYHSERNPAGAAGAYRSTTLTDDPYTLDEEGRLLVTRDEPVVDWREEEKDEWKARAALAEEDEAWKEQEARNQQSRKALDGLNAGAINDAELADLREEVQGKPAETDLRESPEDVPADVWDFPMGVARFTDSPNAHVRMMRVPINREGGPTVHVLAKIDPFVVADLFAVGGGPREYILREVLIGDIAQRAQIGRLREALDRWEDMLTSSIH